MFLLVDGKIRIRTNNDGSGPNIIRIRIRNTEKSMTQNRYRGAGYAVFRS